jgi:hypothetical protein
LARSIADQFSARLAGGERQLTALAEYLHNRSSNPDAALADLLDAQCGNGEFFESLFIIDNKAHGGRSGTWLKRILLRYHRKS